MAMIRIDGVRHRYDGARGPQPWALHAVDHHWRDGGAYALLGPSGCGKTTMLNIISGLVQPSEGRIHFDDRDVTAVPTERRNIAQVFQFPVLYDTMTVRDNLTFPLRTRRVDPARARRRVDEVAAALELGPLLDRRAAQLGAADKQKVSLGRGLVRSDVAAILFDEPLTVVDPQVKFELRRKLKEIHAHFRLTLVYVTHDQTEALTFADEVVVMNEGEIVQAGTPQQLFERPEHVFVGHFIGSPGMNFLPCALHGDALAVAGMRMPLRDALRARLGAARRVVLGIRPHALRLAAPDAPGVLPARLLDIEHLGTYRLATLRVGDAEAGLTLKARLPEMQHVAGPEVGVVLNPRHSLLYADDRLAGAIDEQD